MSQTSTTTPMSPEAQREALLESERQASKAGARNFKEDALTDKAITVAPDGTGPTSTGTFDAPQDQRQGSGTPAPEGGAAMPKSTAAASGDDGPSEDKTGQHPA